MKKFIVSEQEENQTLEKYVKKSLPGASLNLIYKLFRKKDIKVNGHWEDKKYIVKNNEEITIYVKDSDLNDTSDTNITPKDNLSKYIVYEDNNLLMINKPRGILTQKAEARDYSLDVMVLEYLTYKNEYDNLTNLAFTPGPAHRLDRNTSGLILFGKNISTLQYLFSLLKDKEELDKHYLTLVKGEIFEDGEICAPLKKDLETGKVIVASIKDGAKKAKTIYKVVQRFNGYTLLDVKLVTGRTHQIRVHMAYIKHPVIGDTKYGDFKENKYFEKLYGFKNQFLHAYKLVFKNVDEPISYLKNRTIEISLNEEYKNLLNKLK
jgi:23S rRNA pseudouridine955/2504/2580 synthase